MRRPVQAHALNLEGLADERIEVGAGDDDVAAKHAGRFLHRRKSRAQILEDFLREKRDLSLVVLLVIVEAVAPNSMARDALDPIDFERGMIIRRPAGVAEIVVAG